MSQLKSREKFLRTPLTGDMLDGLLQCFRSGFRGLLDPDSESGSGISVAGPDPVPDQTMKSHKTYKKYNK